MLPPKAILDTLASHASRLFSGDNPLPRSEIEAQLKALLQSAFGKLDLVSREEFDSQMAVLARTGGMTGVDFTGKRYDMGNKLGVMEAQVETALKHPEIGPAFRAYLKELSKTL